MKHTACLQFNQHDACIGQLTAGLVDCTQTRKRRTHNRGRFDAAFSRMPVHCELVRTAVFFKTYRAWMIFW